MAVGTETETKTADHLAVRYATGSRLGGFSEVATEAYDTRETNVDVAVDATTQRVLSFAAILLGKRKHKRVRSGSDRGRPVPLE